VLKNLLVPRPVAPQSVPLAGAPTPYSGPPVTLVASDAGELWIPADDGIMLPYIRSRGSWDEIVGKLLLERGRPGMTFLDIGASFGYFTRLVAKHFPTAVIHSFEPHPVVASILALNAWETNGAATIWPLALGETTGTVGITVAETNVGDSRVHTEDNQQATMVAALARLDDLITGPVDLVKIDVQGFESSVINGMVRIADENPQIKIVSEYWPAPLRDRGLDPLSTLRLYREAGYRVRVEVHNVLQELSDNEILRFCDSAGRNGEATLLLERS
jgi:FkbM family methyltransferase